RLEWIFHTAHAIEKPDDTPETKAANAITVKLGEVVGTTVMTSSGVITESSFRFKDREKPTDRFLASLLAGADEISKCHAPTLPEEAVGVGAEWDVMRIVQSFSMRYQRTSTYTLVSQEGGRIRLRVKEAYSAPSQALAPLIDTNEKFDAKIDALTG